MNFLTLSFLIAIFLWSIVLDPILILIWSFFIIGYTVVGCILNFRNPNSFRKKVQIATWNDSGDPTVFSRVEVNVGPIENFLKKYNEQNQNNKISLTLFFIKALAVALSEAKKHIGKIHFMQFTPLPIDLSVLVNIEGENLALVVLRDCENRSLQEMNEDYKSQVKSLKSQKNADFKKQNDFFKLIPTFIVQILLRIFAFISSDLGIGIPFLKVKPNNFGVAGISNVIDFQMTDGFACAVPFTKSFAGLVMNTPVEKPVVVEGEVVIQKIMNLNINLDHRFMDAYNAVKSIAKLREILQKPDLIM